VPRWGVEVALREGAGVTTVTFTHRMSPADAVGDIGPGWLYYLDRVEASRTDAPMPEWDDYYPALKGDYEAKLAAP
jgi:hypothetical protein